MSSGVQIQCDERRQISRIWLSRKKGILRREQYVGQFVAPKTNPRPTESQIFGEQMRQILEAVLQRLI
jgi:hypothetical protein